MKFWSKKGDHSKKRDDDAQFSHAEKHLDSRIGRAVARLADR